ncbi:hypothetical protein HMI48_13620 [Acidithiobacillus ferrooxidans]|uniref:hypothetical protein n=1 Tax=Acidithiobacillus ferrooxidans TaxID=920 RepID=UPI001C06E668|nr:hypothetical protein [Acidithiobacillus ferrooxidans]MBU2774860.1 hypothetical protein [Acidithiobacillus ferrooxidans]
MNQSSNLPKTFQSDLDNFKKELDSYKFNLNFVLGPILLSIDFLTLTVKDRGHMLLTAAPFFFDVLYQLINFNNRNKNSARISKKKHISEYKNGLIELKKLMSYRDALSYSISAGQIPRCLQRNLQNRGSREYPAACCGDFYLFLSSGIFLSL